MSVLSGTQHSSMSVYETNVMSASTVPTRLNDVTTMCMNMNINFYRAIVGTERGKYFDYCYSITIHGSASTFYEKC